MTRLPFLLLLAVPVSAGVVYSNGALNGTITGRTINSGQTVADSFTLSSDATLRGAVLGIWLFPGDELETVSWRITSLPLGGTEYGSGTADVIDTFLFLNNRGYNVYTAAFGLSPVSLAAGTFWLEIGNAVTEFGWQAYWDVNQGPSEAWQTGVGNLRVGELSGSEWFQLLDESPAAVPEPGGLLLLGAGMLVVAGLTRRHAA